MNNLRNSALTDRHILLTDKLRSTVGEDNGVVDSCCAGVAVRVSGVNLELVRSDILLAILRIEGNSHLQSLACSNVERSVSKSDAFLSAVLVAVFSHCSEAALVVHAY